MFKHKKNSIPISVFFLAKFRQSVKSKNVVQTSERVFFEIFQKICQKGRGKRLNFPELDYLLLHVAKNSKILKKNYLHVYLVAKLGYILLWMVASVATSQN